MRRLWIPVAIVFLLAAGCIGAEERTATEPTEGMEDQTAAGPTGNDPAGGDLADPPPRFADPVNVTTEKPGAEPMLDVASDGTIYLTGTGPGNTAEAGRSTVTAPTQPVFRSRDDGETWTEITPAVPTAGHTGLDNALAVGGDGTVYYANAAGTTLQVYRSTDRGESWLPALTAPFPNPMHRTWFASEGNTTIHLAVESLSDFRNWHHASTDSGVTWGPPTPMHSDPGFGSDLAIDPNDGTLYIARTSLVDSNTEDDPGWDLWSSTDGGTTWTEHEMFPKRAEVTASWQSLEVGPNGTIYMVWAQAHEGTSLVHYAFSTDGGDSWSEPKPLVEVDGSQTLPWMDVRGPGELGVLWYAADEPGLPGELDADWHVDYAIVEEADTADPSAHRVRVTDRPIHQGAICTDGPWCDSGRDLLDFTWIEFGPDDRAHLAYASTMWDKPSAFPVYAGELEPWSTG